MCVSDSNKAFPDPGAVARPLIHVMSVTGGDERVQDSEGDGGRETGSGFLDKK